LMVVLHGKGFLASFKHERYWCDAFCLIPFHYTDEVTSVKGRPLGG
jgi:hypothetical protein